MTPSTAKQERGRIEAGVLEHLAPILTEAEKNIEKMRNEGDDTYAVPKSTIKMAEWIEGLLVQAASDHAHELMVAKAAYEASLEKIRTAHRAELRDERNRILDLLEGANPGEWRRIIIQLREES